MKKLKVGDILEVSMSIELLDVPEDVAVIDFDDYKQAYSIDYSLQGSGLISSCDFELDKGDFYTDDITEVIKEDIPSLFKEIKDYEIFDIENFNNESFYAKVRIKAVN